MLSKTIQFWQLRRCLWWMKANPWHNEPYIQTSSSNQQVCFCHVNTAMHYYTCTMPILNFMWMLLIADSLYMYMTRAGQRRSYVHIAILWGSFQFSTENGAVQLVLSEECVLCGTSRTRPRRSFHRGWCPLHQRNYATITIQYMDGVQGRMGAGQSRDTTQ